MTQQAPPNQTTKEKTQPMSQLVTLIASLRARLAAARQDEGGFAIAEALAMAALGVALLIVLFGALQALGLDVIAGIRDQIGL